MATLPDSTGPDDASSRSPQREAQDVADEGASPDVQRPDLVVE